MLMLDVTVGVPVGVGDASAVVGSSPVMDVVIAPPCTRWQGRRLARRARESGGARLWRWSGSCVAGDRE